ncbi:ATP-binding protein [Agromyces sp. GXS1127]|uniref:ATP-binding protein n=1 Tax=Agromyces sp. GXS1127 TaxID=3424181 RepID=UPI003D31CA12
MSLFELEDIAESTATRTGIHIGQWRLSRVELLNWGTFDGHHRIDVARKGQLFTGASGSGKSSLLDGIAAVLTPDKWLRFNAAAQDASSRSDDRSLVSYVRGAWSREADEALDRAVSRYLRPKATWSGILLRFDNLRDEPVTLVRLFHLRGTSVDRNDLRDACLLDRRELGLLDFAEFVSNGIDARRIKAAWPDATVTTSNHGAFYGRARRLLRINSEHALNLLHKTQSAKNLGTLDHLFRTFMLDRPSTFDRADNAVEQFGELSEAHRLVVDLRHQAEHLRGLSGPIADYERESRIAAETERLGGLIDVFQDRLMLQLAESDRGDLLAEHARTEDVARRAESARAIAAEALQAAQRLELQAGGGDAELARRGVDDAVKQVAAVDAAWGRFAEQLASVGLDQPPTDATEFAELREQARAELSVASPAAVHDHDANQAYFDAQRRLKRIDAELAELRDRRSNIRPELLVVRKRLAEELGIRETALPFAGELIEVLPEFADWTGAIERVLQPISSALLVRDEHLADVRRRIEHRNLGTRLVIEAVPMIADAPRAARSQRSLLHRVRIGDHPLGAWLRWRLSGEFDVECVDHPDELDRVDRGVTIGGQIKKSARRYEKDDRRAVDDRRFWILGGDNTAKVDLLLADRAATEQRVRDAAAALDRAQRERDDATRRRTVLEGLQGLDWAAIDRASANDLVTARRAELERLTTGNVALRDAVAAVDAARLRHTEAEQSAREASVAFNLAKRQLDEVEGIIASLQDRVASTSLDAADATDLEARYRSVRRRISRADVAEVSRQVTNALHSESNLARRRLAEAQNRFTEGATAFKARWAAESADLTAQIGDRGGYLALLGDIESRGLPEHEGNFLKLLREKSRDLIGHLLDDLRSAPRQVEERIDPVNASLGRSQFDIDRFLRIRVKIRRAPEVERFMADLKTVVDGNWNDEDFARSEARFAVLREIMQRLGSSDHTDRQWRSRCLDTREHVTFMAQEVDRAGRVVNVHDSSAGLSGGQRQKLVIFCLAAALRYQLTADEDRLPSYATIVLDEAFDKADSRYTRMAMDVFTEFGFHMILATPEKLLQTIEPYVGAITSITNPTRQASHTANVVLEVEESRDEPGPSPDVAATVS